MTGSIIFFANLKKASDLPQVALQCMHNYWPIDEIINIKIDKVLFEEGVIMPYALITYTLSY